MDRLRFHCAKVPSHHISASHIAALPYRGIAWSRKVVFKAVSVGSTAVFARVMFRREIGRLRGAALVALLVGAVLCEQSTKEPPSAAHPVSGSEWQFGMFGCVAGALSFAAQAVGFEGAADHVRLYVGWPFFSNAVAFQTESRRSAHRVPIPGRARSFDVLDCDCEINVFSRDPRI